MKCLKCKKTIEKDKIYGLHYNCFLDWFQLDKSLKLSDLDSQEPSIENSKSDQSLKLRGLDSQELSIESSKSDQSLKFSDLDPKNHTSYSGPIIKSKDSFYHGQYRKYSAKLNSIHYILKVQESKYPDLPGMEYLCNKIAELLAIEVPKYYLIRYPEEESLTFVTRNFIQDYNSATLNHIYKFLPAGNKHYTCENIIKLIEKETQSLRDVEKFVKISLFDSLIGNNDRHGRNLGIIDLGRKRKLAHTYDNPSYFATVDESMLKSDFNISGSIWTSQTTKPKLVDYIQEFKRLKYEQTCLNFLKKIIKTYPLILEEIKQAEISKTRKQAFISFLSQRLKDCKKSIEEGF